MEKLTIREIEVYKKMLASMVVENKADEEKQKRFSPGKEFGKAVYNSFSDNELLGLLKMRAKVIDHTPSQNEVPRVFRDYLKLRFGKWAYAVKKSGLNKAAGKGGKSFEAMEKDIKEKKDLLNQLRKISIERGYIIHPHQIPELQNKIRKFFKNWNDVVTEMNLDLGENRGGNIQKIGEIDEDTARVLEDIKIKAYQRGRAPLKKEIDENTRKMLIKKFGTWRNVLFQIDLEPIKRIKPFANTYLDHRKKDKIGTHERALKDCYYRILNLDEEDKKILWEIKKRWDEKGKKPEKTDFPREKIKILSKKCGSWKNIIYQIETNFEDRK